MKAAVFHGPGQPLTIEQVEIDEPKEREVIVRTVASGVCHSDLHFVDGLYMWPTPAVLGHEAAGVVEKVGSQVSYLKPGDHVIACLSVFCGYCEDCMSGHPNLCSNKAATQRGAGDKPRLSQNGKMVNQFADLSGYAEKMLLHENALVKIGNDVPLDRAALIGCGVMTGVGAALNTAKVAPGSTVAVFGAGGVGLAIIQGARIAGARMIIAVDKFPAKLELAKKLGATHAVDASKGDPVAQIRALTGDEVSSMPSKRSASRLRPSKPTNRSPTAASPPLSGWSPSARKSTSTAFRCCTRSASRDASWARTVSASTCRASSSSISKAASTSTT